MFSLFPCGAGTQSQIDKATAQFQMSQWGMASASAYVTAQSIAKCATKNGALASPGDKNLIGQLLAMSAIAMQRGGMDSSGDLQSDTAVRAQYAITLLSMDAKSNKVTIEQLQQSGIFPPKGPETSDTSDFKLTANEAVVKFRKNQLAFDAQYYGKTLRLSGKVLSLYGDQKSATVILEGIVKSNDERGSLDSAYCRLTDPAAIANLMKIEEGAAVVVRGVLNRRPLTDSGVSLADCRLLL